MRRYLLDEHIPSLSENNDTQNATDVLGVGI